ncbi:MAG: nitrous oxide-stimulated promoter family protein [Ignavibacteria bacterium]|nr:nitrous oxide-stimulated promoter family protein [Ignavibacteria bacterium]
MEECKKNNKENRRIRRERITVEKMIKLYCEKNHYRSGVLCGECMALLDYARERLEKCTYKDDKPVCTKCTVHCYKPEMRDRVREVMRFSGPRMMFRHPYLALMHLINEKNSITTKYT